MKEIIISKFLKEILSEISKLSMNDIAKIESGQYSLSLKINVNKNKEPESKETTKLDKTQVMEQLKRLKTRDEGYEILSKYFQNKKELEGFARSLDISVSKQDKSEQIKEKIIESTIGAFLRSYAIQGKKI